MNAKILIISGLFFFFLVASCKKVQIEGQTLDVYPIVVEAVMSDRSPVKVILSRAVPLNVPTAPAIENATVNITDENGDTQQLTEAETGHFSAEMVPAPGQTYTLQIRTNEDVFTATAQAPAGLLAIDTVTFERQNDSLVTLYCRLRMPSSRPVYARLKVVVDGFLSNDMFIEKTLEESPAFDRNIELGNVFPGSQAIVEVLTLSKPSFEFYQAIGLNTFGTNFSPVNAKNPPTNLTGGAIGFFSVVLADTASLVIW